MKYILLALLIVVILLLIVLIALITKKSSSNIVDNSEVMTAIDKSTYNTIGNVNQLLMQSNQGIRENNKDLSDNIKSSIRDFMEFEKQSDNTNRERLTEIQTNIDRELINIKIELTQSLNKLREENSVELDKMRVIVDEKLQVSLENRLTLSFKSVSDNLEKVILGIGEVRTLADGVTDLKKVLGNVKTRGVWGEAMLKNLLEQILVKGQYEENYQVVPNSAERVEFAIILPGKNEEKIVLPIDCKFPIEEYYRLVEFVNIGDIPNIELCQKALDKTFKECAKKINEKYIKPPYSTDFAIMYLPIEALYGEVARNTFLLDELNTKYRITVAGPSTISAILSSLQMGFKTLAIEKRSIEIRQILTKFRSDFNSFSTLLDKTQKKLEEIQNTIDQATKRTSIIGKRLSKVENDENDDSGIDLIE